MNEAPAHPSSSLPPLRTLSRWSRAGGVVHEIVLMALGYLASLLLLAGIFDATDPSSAIKIALAPIATFGGVLPWVLDFILPWFSRVCLALDDAWRDCDGSFVITVCHNDTVARRWDLPFFRAGHGF